MEWSDEGVILTARAHSETNAVVEVFTRDHGRHLGLVRGGRSKRLRPVLQTGNHVSAKWRARLQEHLGNFTLELVKPYAAAVIDDRLSLAGVASLGALSRLLPERDPHQGLYEAIILILDHIEDKKVWPGLMVRWEFELLNELGFGLDLSACAATGSTQDLIYVSPKSGRAVSREAGEPFKDKLLPLPAFLCATDNSVTGDKDIIDGFELTGFFLQTRIFEPRGLEFPEARARLLHYLQS